jgi:CheY-like chemotaxis protein
MLSASAHPGIAERALELGAQDFLVKPFDPILLKRTVFKALGREL